MVTSMLMNECLGLNLEFAQSTVTSQFSTHLSSPTFLSRTTLTSPPQSSPTPPHTLYKLRTISTNPKPFSKLQNLSEKPLRDSSFSLWFDDGTSCREIQGPPTQTEERRRSNRHWWRENASRGKEDDAGCIDWTIRAKRVSKKHGSSRQSRALC